MRRTIIALGFGCFCIVLGLRAENPAQPVIQSMIGGYVFDTSHSYVAESQIRLPMLRLDPLSVSYRHYEITPVLREGSQTQLMYSREELEAEFSLNEHLRLMGAGGYRRTALQDRAGFLSAYAFGVGLGSSLRPEPSRLEWSAMAGGFAGRESLEADWWADLHLAWRAYEFGEGRMLETTFRPMLGLALDVESANDGGRFHAVYKLGPVLEILTANGNRARFQARWVANDGNPFFEKRHSGMLVGVEVNASLDKDKLYDMRDQRPLGWLPVVWGHYDVGYGGSRSIQRTELNAEVHDILVKQHPVTAVLFYESRQELRTGDFDNTSYTISFGGQTRVGLESLFSQGQPLVLGAEYLHRSAHALSPDADRVPPPEVVPHSSLNLLRLRLQTLGWDLPYRDPSIYQAKTAWLNRFDWRFTLGHDLHHSRNRSNPAAQIGLNWDAATIQGCVIYARGLGSIGNETPDWLAEIGVRRKAGRLFLRHERYGLERDLARGNTLVVGVGFAL